MSDEPDPVETAARCAHCAGPLPAPIERLAVVVADELMTTCSAACLALLVAALAGQPSPDRRTVTSRQN